MEGIQALRRLVQGADMDGKQTYLSLKQLIEDMKIEPNWDMRVFFDRYEVEAANFSAVQGFG